MVDTKLHFLLELGVLLQVHMVVGRIQFLVTVGLSPSFLAAHQLGTSS